MRLLKHRADILLLKKRQVRNNKDFNSAKNTCFRLLKFRPRSEKELRNNLIGKGFDKGVIDQVILEFSRLKLVDDAAFARLWVESRIKKPLGINRLSFELKIKGIDKKIIEQVINEYDCPEKEENIVRGLVEQKIKKLTNLNKEKIKNRLFGLLLRRGFSRDVVYDVLNEL